ncbi:MAG: exodeoxyribonuclease VII large subunit [Zoogloeaceae bacterium]|jgi:exodeoxyribonuclease VII large subunit|nr:exodeoxyribonuclease VII large subunit [Zoogloeaceae bacterium]
MPDFADFPAARAVLSVRELNLLARRLVEQIPLLWVAGEISNLVRAASGHLYFTLKDADAQVRCTIWRNKAQLLGFRPENGQKVEARALATLYEARGEFQLSVETLRQAGQGRLFEQFTVLKSKLETEGLFRTEHKRPLPRYPRNIAIVTSPQAAALRDVLATLARRAPHVELQLFPTPVQGEGAAADIVRALTAASASAADLILLCRGGGSLEDLWCFNEEAVARAIRASHLPVVCGVGHETDFTIADFAADLRAPTPTAAAELAAPDRQNLLAQLAALRQRLDWRQENRLGRLAERLEAIAARLHSPAQRLALQQDRLNQSRARLILTCRQQHERRREHLATLAIRLGLRQPALAITREHLARVETHLRRAARALLESHHARLEQRAQALRQLDPHAILKRGYALALDAANRVVRSAESLQPDMPLRLLLAEGEVQVKVGAD